MPSYCKFYNRQTGEAEQIWILNKLICEAMDWEIKKDDLYGYDLFALIGFAILSTGGDEVTKERFDEHVGRVGSKFDPQTEATLRRFLYEEYRFEGWYQCT